MEDIRRLVVIPAALICIAGGCGKFLGIESHSLAPDAGAGAGGAAGTLSGSAGSVAGAAGGSSGSDAGTMSDSRYVSDGEAQGGPGCVVEGGVSDAGATDAAAAMACGFTMPNPADAGLPNPASYTPIADGTIKDNVTSLVWEGTVNANAQYKQGEAIDHCTGKGSGWRLPTRLELVSLVDFTKQGPTIASDFVGTPAQRYWTSSIFACDPSSAYYVGFDSGSVHPVTPDNPYWLRCVKGGPSRCVGTRYQVIEAGKSVHDAVTGLTWQRDFGPQQTWSQAMTSCAPGWRLPSLTELQTIVDETRGGQGIPPIDGNAFLNTPLDYFWTSSPQAGDSQHAWYVAFIHGHADLNPITSKNYVRCVRWDGTSTP